jgi:hypothetical protein
MKFYAEDKNTTWLDCYLNMHGPDNAYKGEIKSGIETALQEAIRRIRELSVHVVEDDYLFEFNHGIELACSEILEMMGMEK